MNIIIRPNPHAVELLAGEPSCHPSGESAQPNLQDVAAKPLYQQLHSFHFLLKCFVVRSAEMLSEEIAGHY